MEEQNNKKKLKIVIISLIVAVIASGVLFGFRISKNGKSGNREKEQQVISSLEKEYQPVQMHMSKTVTSKAIPPVRVKDRAWRRNPFIPVEKRLIPTGSVKQSNDHPAPSPSFELQGVVKSDRGICAIINGKSCEEGNVVSGWRIVKIDDYRVWLRRAGKSLKLELSEKPGEIRVR